MNPIVFLQLSLGLVYFYFGILKLFPDLSPAEFYAEQTTLKLSFNLFSIRTSLILVALFECWIGLSFLFGWHKKLTPYLFFIHMFGTFTPLFFFPELTFKITPFAPAFEGQYIIKNIVFIAAGVCIFTHQQQRGHNES